MICVVSCAYINSPAALSTDFESYVADVRSIRVLTDLVILRLKKLLMQDRNSVPIQVPQNGWASNLICVAHHIHF